MNPRNSVLHAAVMTDYHNKGYGQPAITLATMRCYRIENAHNAQVGDFVYHYSSQLDAFALCEVMKVVVDTEPNSWARTKLETVIIDDDIQSQIGKSAIHNVNADGKIYAYEVYRPDPQDRLTLETKGGAWEGDLDFISVLAGRNDTRRKLRNCIHYVPPVSVLTAPVAKAGSWFKRLFGG